MAHETSASASIEGSIAGRAYLLLIDIIDFTWGRLIEESDIEIYIVYSLCLLKILSESIRITVSIFWCPTQMTVHTHIQINYDIRLLIGWLRFNLFLDVIYLSLKSFFLI